jgi:DNA-binding NarL/FixJ family response regulator
MARAVIFDTDAEVRAAVAALLDDGGHSVIGQAESSEAAVDLIDRERPDIAIVDVTTRFSTGRAVLSEAALCGCRAIVYSTYIEPGSLHEVRGAPIGVMKPDLVALAHAIERAVAGLEGTPTQRRRASRPGLSGDDFFEALAAADVGDAIIVLEPMHRAPRELEIVGEFAERTVAGGDRVVIGDGAIGILLSAGGSDGVVAVLRRLKGNSGRQLDDWHVRSAVISEGERPKNAYLRLAAQVSARRELMRRQEDEEALEPPP